ncbi:MAG: MBL fold metallo-hydrolase [Candidatus Limnocylindrales bacterium]
MFIRQFRLDGLGHLSTLVGDEEAGVAAVVDPRRDVDIYLETARRHGLRISHVFETHLHNDYVSGGRELVAATGAEQLIGAGAELAYPHRPVRQGDIAAVGALEFQVEDTPGHTPEHVAYALADTSRALEPSVLFSGGSLLVGAVGRTDLLGAENALPLARSMFHSLHDRILAHEDFVGVFPTHGAGSLCSTGIGSTLSSTIGFERRYNPLLQPTEFDAFARALLAGQPTVPRYFARMRPTNQAGPRVLGGIPGPAAIPLGELRRIVGAGGLLIDLRSPRAFAASHVPGSLSIPLGSSFGTWLGWVVDYDRPAVFILPGGPEGVGAWDDAIRQALRIGHESITGYLEGGFATWADAGLPVESNGRLSVGELASLVDQGGTDAPLVVDVRQASEFDDGHVTGAWHIGAGDLPNRLAELPRDRPIATVCAAGYRASVAASLLAAAGFTNISWVAGGMDTWTADGRPLERGSGSAGAPSAAAASTSSVAAGSASLEHGHPHP